MSPAELDLFQKNVVRVAQTCFNLLPTRAPAISDWLAVQNAGTFRRASSTFGPMRLAFLRSGTDDGQFYTAVSMTRSGVPGEAPWPWTGWCTP